MSQDERKILQFHEMELDDRLLKAISQLGWLEPTLIQEAAIPLLLEGKNVIVKARTGSGKTAAYALPLIQKILNNKMHATEQCITTLILTPSKELCEQTRSSIEQMCNTCDKTIKVADLSINELATQKHLLSQKPDILVSTPAKVLVHLQESNFSLKYLETLIVDEADLVFSYGFEKDFQKIVDYLPPIYQVILVSATITEEIIQMKGTILKNPVILKLEESELVPTTQLSHQRILAEENDKPAILYALLKLRLVRGKNVIFVNSVDRCYKLKLFMEQFGIRSCALNSELPSKIRIHTINQFNKGIYDFIIASDEYTLENPGTGRMKNDFESSASRGIDFQCVTNVINFDFPNNVTSYIHRAGRTARGQNKGTVLSFVSLKDQGVNDAVEARLQGGYVSGEQIIKNYQFKLEEVEPFRYRAQDAWRAVTRIAVHEARIREIRQELFNNEKLKGFFSEHTRDLEVLRHDKPLKTVKVQAHLSHIPEYIIPQALKRVIATNSNSNANTANGSATTMTTPNITNKKPRYFHSSAKAIYENKMNNPLLCSGLDFGKKIKTKTKNNNTNKKKLK